MSALFNICVLIIVGVLLFIFLKEDTNDYTLKITFSDNASTGYQWKYVLSKEDIVEITSKTDYSNCPKDVDGCGGKITFTVTPLKEGEVTINFNLTSHSDEVDETVIYNIKVDNNLKISETHTNGK